VEGEAGQAMIDRLFVYGTLRRGSGHPLACRLQQGAEYLGLATVAGRLYRVAHYPGLVPARQPGQRVVGDLFRLRQPRALLAWLDRYEECGPGFPRPTEYLRRAVRVHPLGGAPCRAWVYLYNRDTAGLAPIPGGDFLSG